MPCPPIEPDRSKSNFPGWIFGAIFPGAMTPLLVYLWRKRRLRQCQRGCGAGRVSGKERDREEGKEAIGVTSQFGGQYWNAGLDAENGIRKV